MWIELHDYKEPNKTYIVNTDNVCLIYPGQTGSGRGFTWVKFINPSVDLTVRESIKEISELMRKGTDNEIN